jgi:hypothetical protein
MPFDNKSDPVDANDIDFNHVCDTQIKPVVEDAGMEPIRADKQKRSRLHHSWIDV